MTKFFKIIFNMFLLISFLCLTTISAGKIKSVTLSDEKIQLKANTRSIISCYFTPRSSIRNDKVSLEWEKEKGGEYIPLIQFVDNKVKKVSLQDNRFQVFKNLVHRGNCSLIISSTKLIDSGNYQLRLTVGGKLFKPLPRIKVQVEKTKELKQGRLHAPHSGNKNWKKPISDNRKLSTALNHVTSDEKDGEKQPSSNHAKLTPELIAGVTSICSVAVLTFVIACVVYCYRTRSKQKAPAQDEERLTSPEKEMDPKDPKPQCRSKKARKKDKADQENPKPQGLTSPEKEMDPKDLKPQCRSKKARKKDKADQENTKPQGFPNLGNTCYMNATLQSLLSVQPFVSDLLQQKIPYKTFQEFVFIRNLYNLIRRKDRYSLKKRRKLLLKLKDSVSISAERFADNEQHDAHDFLTECFSLMKEDIAQLSNEMKNPISCPVKSNFEFDLEYIYICNKCGETRISVNQNNCLFVDILQEDSNSDSASETLQDAVDYYFLDETVEFSCEKCGGNESTLKQKFRSLPRVLIVKLKRYGRTADDTFRIGKLKDKIGVTLSLAVASHCTARTTLPPTSPEMDGNVEEKETKKSEKKKPSKKNKFQPYELKSIVNHSGESAEYGHYFSDVYDRRTKTWLAYDDADINEIDEDVLLPSRAYTGYLFFYIHKSFLE